MLHNSLRDINKQPVEFDENRPIVFLDIDGVINALPYEREYIGPKTGSFYDHELFDPKNWKTTKLEPNLKEAYPITGRYTVLLDRYAEYSEDRAVELSEAHGRERFKKITINLMADMLSDFRSIVQDYDLQVIYLTFWKSEALRLLEPELQLGATAYLDWWTGSDRGHRLKIDSLMRLYEETDIRTPFAVFDDESTVGLKTDIDLWPTRRMNNDRLAQHRELNQIPKLIFTQDPRWGIQRAELLELRKFAESLKA